MAIGLRRAPMTTTDLRVVSIVSRDGRCLINRRHLTRRLRHRHVYRLARRRGHLHQFVHAVRRLPETRTTSLQPMTLRVNGHAELPTPNIIGRGLHVFSRGAMRRLFVVCQTTHCVSRDVCTPHLRLTHMTATSTPRVHRQPVLPRLAPGTLLIRLHGPRTINVHHGVLHPRVRHRLHRGRVDTSTYNDNGADFTWGLGGGARHRLPHHRTMGHVVLHCVRGRLIREVGCSVFQHRVARVGFMGSHTMFRVVNRPQQHGGGVRY